MKRRGQEILDPEQRIMSFVEKDKDTGCWNWNGSKKGFGYGYLLVGSRVDNSRKTWTAHRYSYHVFKGIIPKGKWVLHRCDNPACVNPEHLYLGVRADNVNDRETRGRNKVPCLSGEMHPNAILTEVLVALVREKLSYGYSCSEIGRVFNVSGKTISDIKLGKTWKTSTLPAPPQENKP